MEPARYEAIANRPELESSREGFPQGFPDPIDVPAARYVDPAFFELEREHVFEKSWLFAAHDSQLPEPGDYLMLDALAGMGHPVFLVRGRDRKVRAFYNACQHRGGPLVDRLSGSVGTNLVCKYHAWTYDLEGRLLGFPEAKNFPRNRKSTCPPLRGIECDSWGSLLFVKIAAGGPGLREFLEPVATEMDELIGDRAGEVHLSGIKRVPLECNWKLPGDGNIETYHVPYLHRDTAAHAVDEQRTGQWLLQQGHSRMLAMFRRKLPEDLPLPRFRGDTSLMEVGIYSFHVFPNFSIVAGSPNTILLVTAFPDGPERCTYATHVVTPVERTDETAAVLDKNVDMNWSVLQEDLSALVPAQKAMSCGATDVLRLQYQERRIRYVHEEIDRRIGPENVPPALRVPPVLDDWVEDA